VGNRVDYGCVFKTLSGIVFTRILVPSNACYQS